MNYFVLGQFSLISVVSCLYKD